MTNGREEQIEGPVAVDVPHAYHEVCLSLRAVMDRIGEPAVSSVEESRDELTRATHSDIEIAIPVEVAQVDRSGSVVFTGDVAFPHYSVRVLSPSRNKIPKPTAVEWLIREDDHLRLLIESGGVSDTLDIEVALPVDRRTKLADDGVRWSRSDGTDPIEIKPSE